MRWDTKKSLLLAGLISACAMFVPSAASAAAWSPCAFTLDQLECARYELPLDRVGGTGGVADVQVIKANATEGPKLGTLFVIAGGPGQPSNVMLDFMTSLFSGANRYDLIAIDQRGTGLSEPLDCPAVESGFLPDSESKQDAIVTRCATAIGPGRGGYSTAESISDMEAVRQDLGVDQISLFGVSYGTKVALQYAQTFPTHVRSLMIDSVLPVQEPGPFDLVSIAAMRKSLDEICSSGRCNNVLSAPVTKLHRLASRMAAVPIQGTFLSPTGRPQDVKLDATALYNLMFEADFNLFIYEQLPAAIDAALKQNDAPLLRLFGLLQSSGGSVKAVRSKPAAKVGWHSLQARRDAAKRRAAAKKPVARDNFVAEFSNTLNLDTSCEDFTPPWPRGSAVTGRQPAIDAAADAVPDSALYPFDRKTVKDEGLASICRGWPEASPAPSTTDPPLPNVPLLALGGSLDVRTPLAWAKSAVTSDPQAQVVEIAHTGHSTIGTDVSGCALSLAKRFLIFGATDGKCTRKADPVPVAPRVADSLQTVSALRGSCRGAKGRKCTTAKRVVTAGYQAFRDALDQYVIGGLDAGPGLYGGQWSLGFDLANDFSEIPATIDMEGMEQVPGIVADGSVRIDGYPSLSAHFSVIDFSGRSYRVEISGKAAFDSKHDRITLAARSGKVRVTLKRGSRTRAPFSSVTASSLRTRSRFAYSAGTRQAVRR